MPYTKYTSCDRIFASQTEVQMGQVLRDVENPDRRLEEIRQQVESTMNSVGIDVNINQEPMPMIQPDSRYDNNPIPLQGEMELFDFQHPIASHRDSHYSPIPTYRHQPTEVPYDYYGGSNDLLDIPGDVDPDYDQYIGTPTAGYYQTRYDSGDEGSLYDYMRGDHQEYLDRRDRSSLSSSAYEKHSRDFETPQDQYRKSDRRDDNRDRRDRHRNGNRKSRDGREDGTKHGRDSGNRQWRSSGGTSREDQGSSRSGRNRTDREDNIRQRSLERSRDSRSDTWVRDTEWNASVDHSKRRNKDNSKRRYQESRQTAHSDRDLNNHNENSHITKEEHDEDIISDAPQGQNYMVKAFFCTLCNIVLLEGRQQLDEHCREKSHYIEFQRNKFSRDEKMDMGKKTAK